MDDEDRESLRGQWLVFSEPFTGRQSPGVTKETVLSEMKKRDMWKIPSEYRGPIYRHMQQALKAAITKKFRELAAEYAAASREAKIGYVLFGADSSLFVINSRKTYVGSKINFLLSKSVSQLSLLPGTSNADFEICQRLWELDYNYMKQAKIIGMTTTGLSKYRGLIQGLKPKIVLVEEAAETLEAFVSVACFKRYVWHSSW